MAVLEMVAVLNDTSALGDDEDVLPVAGPLAARATCFYYVQESL